MPAPGKILNISFQVTCTVHPGGTRVATVAVYKNGVYVDHIFASITGLGDFGASGKVVGLPSSLADFDTGDILTLHFSHSTGLMTTENWACLLRVSNTTV